MEDRNAAGRKTDTELADDLKHTLDRTMEGARFALTRSTEKTADQDDRYDGWGRLRDREIGHAAKLGSISAQLVNALVKLQVGKHEK